MLAPGKAAAKAGSTNKPTPVPKSKETKEPKVERQVSSTKKEQVSKTLGTTRTRLSDPKRKPSPNQTSQGVAPKTGTSEQALSAQAADNSPS